MTPRFPPRLLARLLFATVGAGALLGGAAHALPTGGVVVAQTPGTGATFTVNGNTLTVDQSSQRVVIDWRSFNIDADETVNFNQQARFIAFNRINAANGAVIDGTLTGGGGVWLFSPGGLLFGANARVNVGSFLGSTGALSDNDIDQALTIAAPGEDNIITSTPGESPTGITVRAGAQITASPTGFVALQSEDIRQAGSISGGGVGYVVSKGASARYQESANGVVLKTDIATSGEADVRFNHTGTTQGGFVTLIAPAAAATQGFAGAINLGGVVEAGGIEIPGVPNGLAIRVGDDYAGPGTGGRLTLNTTEGTISVAGDVAISAYRARLGFIAADNVTAVSNTSLSVEGSIQAAGDVLLAAAPTAGALTVEAGIAASGAISLSGDTVEIGPDVVVNSDFDGTSGVDGGIFVQGTRGVSADASSLLITGPGESDPVASIVVRAGLITEGGGFGGDIALGGVVGGLVDIQAIGLDGVGGDITLASSVYGLNGVSVLSTSAGADPTVGVIRVQDRVSAQGPISIINADGGDVVLEAGALVQSDLDGDGAGALVIRADRDVLGDATSQLSGGFGSADVSVSAGEGAAGGSLTVGRVRGAQVLLSAQRGSTGAGDVTTLAQVRGDVGVGISGAGDADLDQILSGGGIGVDMGGDVQANAGMTADGSLVINANTINVAAVTLRADADGQSSGEPEQLGLYARRDINAVDGSLLVTGQVDAPPDGGPASAPAGPPTSAIILRAGLITEGGGFGGSIAVDDVSGSLVDIEATGVADGGSGAIVLGGDVYGAAGVTVTSSRSGAGGGGSIEVLSQVTSNGPITITNANGGDIALGDGALVQSDLDDDGVGALVLTAERSILGAETSQLLGGSGGADVSASAGTGATGGELRVGQVIGRTVSLSAAAGSSGAGDVTTLGLVRGESGVSITGDGSALLAEVSSGGGLSIGMGGDVHATADLTASGSLVVNAEDILIDAVTLRADADGSGGGQGEPERLGLYARGDLTAAAGSLLVAGPSGDGGGAEPTSAVILHAGEATEGGSLGGSLDVDAVSGSTVEIAAIGVNDGGAGDITLNGSVYGREGVTVTSSGLGEARSVSTIRILDEVLSNGPITILNANGGDVLLGEGALVEADFNADGDGEDGLSITADRDVLAAATSRLLAHGSSVSVRSGAAAGGGDLVIGTVQGGDVLLNATGGSGRAGDLTVLGPINGAAFVRIVQSGGPAEGQGVTISGDVASDGFVSIEGSRGIGFDPGVEVAAADGGSQAALQVLAGGDVTVGADASLSGGKGLLIQSGGMVSIAAGATVEGGYGEGGPGAAGWPNIAFSPGEGGVYIYASDLDLQGQLRSVAGDGRGDLFLRLSGAGVVGGSGEDDGGFSISDAEVARMSARNIVVAGDGDLEVRDLTLAADRVSELWLGASGESRITVTGSVSSSGEGRPGVRLGFTAETDGGDQERILFSAVPSDILISGSLGGDGALGQVGMIARNDILMGSDAYLEAAASDGFDPTTSTAPPPAEGHLFVQADGLQLSAGSRILQQNTGANRNFAGLLIGAPTAERPLIFGVSSDQGVGAPTIIDLYGELIGEGGVRITGRDAADVDFLLVDGIPAIEDYRFNGCSFGRGFACPGATAPYFPVELVVTQTTQSFEAVLSVADAFLSVPESPDEERDAMGLPIVGSGNSDLWIGAASEGDVP